MLRDGTGATERSLGPLRSQQDWRWGSSRTPAEVGAFSGKVGTDLGFTRDQQPMSPKSAIADTDLGFTRDRQSMLPKSAMADLGGGGFPQKMRPTQEARARFRFHQIETRSTATSPPAAARRGWTRHCRPCAAR